MPYTHLHLHTDYSLLDGLGKIKNYIKRAKELGMTSLAITDHGTGAGLVDFYNTCKKENIKPILGCEVYVAPDNRFEKIEVDGRRYFHLILLVKNSIGYKNLCILISRGNTEGFYYKPRIDFELLKEHHEGLICLSGCIAGEVAQYALAGSRERAKECVLKYKALFGDDYYLEIQNHGLQDEAVAFSEIINIAQNENIPLVCTNDCHYVNLEDKEAHEWLLCMQTKKKITEEHMAYLGNYSLRPESEMRALFPSLPAAFDNTEEIVNKCNFEFTFGQYKMPPVNIPKSYNNDYFKYLSDLTYEGFEQRYPKGHRERDEAKKRITYELSVIGQMGFSEYFLDIRRTIKDCRDKGILVGPGRGSGAGSVVNYCIGITDIEPLKYGLLFERFLNPERVSMPDIDTDFEDDRKEDVVLNEAEFVGFNQFAKIQTFITMAAKVVIRDCARVAGFPVLVGNKLASMIPAGSSLQEAYALNPEIEEYLNTETGLKQVWSIAKIIEGTKKSSGSHACGHISSPQPCEELFPVSKDQETGYLVCQYDMVEAEHLGNLKKDLLMLRNLTIIKNAQEEIKKNHGTDIPFWTDDILNDKESLKMISSGDTGGVFQIESEGITKFIKDLKPDCFEDMVAAVSLYRPGPMDFIPDYIKGKRNPSEITYLTPALEPILKNTYGVIVYQEQVMQIVRALAGFSMGRADIVRKAMGKKKMDIMLEEKQKFIFGDESLNIPGCVKNGISKEIAETIYDKMIDFAKYAFNKSHAACYAAISMQTAFLKCHYRKEYMAGLLSSVMDKPKKMPKYILQCESAGIKILPPDVNASKGEFVVEGENIRFGLKAIKKVGKDVSDMLVEERIKSKYTSFTDFIKRNEKLNSGAITSLILSGAFDSLGYTRNSLINALESVIAAIKTERKTQIAGQFSLFDIIGDVPEVDKENIKALPEYNKKTLLANEKEVTGVYLSGHPLDSVAKELKDKTNITSESFTIETDEEEKPIFPEDVVDGKQVKYGGIITSVKVIYTKKTSEPMAFITVEDFLGPVSCIVFPKNYVRYKDDLKEDNIIVISGTVSVKEDEISLIVDELMPLTSNNKTIWLKFKSINEYNNEAAFINDFKQKNPGKDTLAIYLENEHSIKKIAIDASKHDNLKIRYGDNIVVSQ